MYSELWESAKQGTGYFLSGFVCWIVWDITGVQFGHLAPTEEKLFKETQLRE